MAANLDEWGLEPVAPTAAPAPNSGLDDWGLQPVTPPLSDTEARVRTKLTNVAEELAKPDAKRTWGEVGTDLAYKAAGGVNAMLSNLGDLYGLATGDTDNWASEQGRSGREYWEERTSPELKSMEAERKAAIDAADNEWTKAGTALWETLKSPSLLSAFLAEQSAMLVPAAGVGRAAAGAAKLAGAGAKTAGAVGTGAAVATGAAQQGADAGSDARERLLALPDPLWEQNADYQARVASGETPEDAKRAVALELSQDAAIVSAIESGALNLLPGARVLERALAGAGRVGSRVANAAKGFVGETLQEGLEEAGGRLAGNVAVGAVDQSQETFEGVGEAGGMGAAAGPFGAVAGATQRPVADDKPPPRGDDNPDSERLARARRRLAELEAEPQSDRRDFELAAVRNRIADLEGTPSDEVAEELEVEDVEAAPPPPGTPLEEATTELENATQADLDRPRANIDVTETRVPVEEIEATEPAPRPVEDDRPATNIEVEESDLDQIPAAPPPLQAALPAPQKTGVFEVSADGAARELSQAEVDIAARSARRREGLVRVPSGTTAGLDIEKSTQRTPEPIEVPDIYQAALDRTEQIKADTAMRRAEKSRQAAQQAAKIDTRQDDLLAAIAKKGGISREAAEAAGIDPAEFSRRGWRIKRVFTTGGMSLEAMSEALADYGYPVTTTEGYGENAMLDALDRALRGDRLTSQEASPTIAPEPLPETDPFTDADPFLADEEYDDLNAPDQQVLLDAMEAAREAGIDEDTIEQTVERGSIRGQTNEEIAAALREYQRPRGTGEVQGEPSQGPRAETPAAETDAPGAEDDAIAPYTAADLAAREQQKRDAEKRRQDEDRRAEADAQRGSFTLTGSDREADEAAARGQGDLLSSKQASAPKTEAKQEDTKTAASSEASRKIDDFGEVLEGARKHYAEAYADRMKDAYGVDVAKESIAKSWPEPDYQKLIDGGADEWSVAFARAARDEVPRKPRKGWKLKGWVEQVTLLRDVVNQVMTGEIPAARVREMLATDKFRRLARDLGGRIELYLAVGHEKSLNGLRLTSHDYSLYEGQKYDPPRTVWSVEKDAKATAMSNWPRTFASADTKEAALAEFKKRFDSLDLDKPARRSVSFDIYSRRDQQGKFFIGKKVGRDYIDLKEFDDIKAARAYLKDNQDELERLLAKAKDIPYERRPENSPRVGVDHRAGADVTPEQFSETFGFRGVQFGNYVEGPRRQQDLNEAYDALMDLAGVIGVPPRALSLNGELGLAFGARGKGKRGGRTPVAHYEHDKVVINLTKNRGAGSLAHEWWHALDNYFSRMRGERSSYLTESPRTAAPADTAVRVEMIDAFKRVSDAVNKAALLQRARRLDKKRTGTYWSTGSEMTARSFEAYIIGKLQDQGQANDYLANIVSPEYWEAATALGLESDNTYPYPMPDEIPAIRAAFDNFFTTVESRETEQGTMLFARRGDTHPNAGLYLDDEGQTQKDRLGGLPGNEETGRASDDEWTRLDGSAADGDWTRQTRARDGDRPALVFHGSGRRLRVEKFEPANFGKNTGSPTSGLGVFFTSDPVDAAGYGDTLSQAYLDLRNPLYVRHTELPQFRDIAEATRWREEKRAEGYDGLILAEPDVKAPPVMVAFDPGQVIEVPIEELQWARQSGKKAPSRGLSIDGARAYLAKRIGQKAVDRLIDRGLLVISNASDAKLPRDARQALSDGDVVYGFAHEGKVYLIADNLSDTGTAVDGREDAFAILMHELGVHYGMREMLGDKRFGSIVAEVEKAANSQDDTELARAARIARANVNTETNPDHVAEETLAWLVTDRANHDLPLVKRILARLRAFLLKIGLTRSMTPDALVELARGAAMRAAGETMVSRATRFASKAVTQTDAFKRWFGDSKVVEENGEPLVVYHGSPGRGSSAIEAFEPSLGESFGGINNVGTWASSSPDAAAYYAGTFDEDGNSSSGPLYPVHLRIENPWVLEGNDGFKEFVRVAKHRSNGGKDIEALREYFRNSNKDGVIIRGFTGDGGIAQDVYLAFEPQQIKSATGNRGTFDPNNSDIRFARRPENETGWIAKQDAETQEALRKAGVWRPSETLRDRAKAWAERWPTRVRQGLVDQFDPIKEYDYKAYMLARMSKSADAALEAVLNYGTIKMDADGAIDVTYEDGGFLEIMRGLKGEHERFLAWVMGRRAERLLAEGKEHNFTPEDIERLKALNEGKMADGRPRDLAYMEANAALQHYNKTVLDVAERAGLIDAESRPLWEKDFYIPFYRQMEDESIKGPVRSSGLVRQYAFKTLKGGAQAIGDPMNNILQNWSHLLNASLKNRAAVEALAAAETVNAARETTQDEKGAVFVMRNGRKVYYAIDDPFLLDAVQSIGYSGFSGKAMKVMQAAKRYLTLGVTVNPTFRVRNIIRDSISAAGVTPTGYNILNNVITGWRGTKEGSQEFGSILAGGGVMRFGTFLEGDRAEHVKRLIDKGVEPDTVLNSQKKVRGMLQAGWDFWQHIGDRAENVNRVALYKKLRKEGKSHLEAAYQARDLMDFSMQGSWAAVRFLTQTVPFMNARLQGLYKLARGAKEDPKRFSTVLGATAMASILLLLHYRDDDDWKQREAWDRETYWWFKIGDKAYRIPKPFEIGVIASIAERGVEAMISDELNGEQFAARLWHMVSEELSLNPVPQLVKPAFEVWANRNSFTDRPIETMGMERLSKAERVSPYTSATAQLVGKATGKAGVLSPVQIDHVIRGYFGWLGTTAVQMADLAVRPVLGLSEKPSWRLDDYPVVGDFVKELPAYQSKYVTRFYEESRKVQEAMADLRHYQKIGALEKAVEILEENRDKIRLYKLYTKAQRSLSKLNAQIRRVQLSKGDPEDKRARLDQLYEQRNRLARLIEERAKQAPTPAE